MAIRGLAWLVVSVAWGLAWAGGAAAAPVGELQYRGPTGAAGLEGATDVAVSPDARNVYVAADVANAVAAFARDAQGALTPLGSITQAGLTGASAVAVTPDGQSVYVAATGSNAITRFQRDAAGALTPVECFQGTVPAGTTACGASGLAGLNEAGGVAVSPDGHSVYVAAAISNAVTRFDRDASGALTFRGCFTQDAAGCTSNGLQGLAGASDVVVSDDGASLYVAAADSNAITHFSRAPDGALTYVGCFTGGAPLTPTTCGANGGLAGLGDVSAVEVSPDGRSVYAASPLDNAVTRFDRDPATGSLTHRGCLAEAGTGCAIPNIGLLGASGVAVTPDGRSVYVAGAGNPVTGIGAVTRLDRSPLDGALTYRGCFTGLVAGCGLDASGLAGLAGATDVAVSSGGASVYVASDVSNDVTRFDRAVDAPPACAPASPASTLRDTPVQVPLGCSDANGDAFTIGFPQGPANGAVAPGAGGAALYTPRAGFVGSDSFSVQAVDLFGVAGTVAQVEVTVVQPAAVVQPPAVVQPAPPLRTTPALRISGLSLTRAFKPLRGAGPSIAARGPFTLTFRLSAAGRVTFRVERLAVGRQLGRRCVVTARRGARCTASQPVAGSFRVTGKAGSNRFRFTGRVGGRALAPGRYRLVAVADGGSRATVSVTIR